MFWFFGWRTSLNICCWLLSRITGYPSLHRSESPVQHKYWLVVAVPPPGGSVVTSDVLQETDWIASKKLGWKKCHFPKTTMKPTLRTWQVAPSHKRNHRLTTIHLKVTWNPCRKSKLISPPLQFSSFIVVSRLTIFPSILQITWDKWSNKFTYLNFSPNMGRFYPYGPLGEAYRRCILRLTGNPWKTIHTNSVLWFLSHCDHRRELASNMTSYLVAGFNPIFQNIG